MSTPYTSSLGTALGIGFVLGILPDGLFDTSTAVGPELDGFSADPGTDAGRIFPADVDTDIPLDGSSIFCLGHDRPGFFSFFRPDDFVEVLQNVDFGSANAITFLPRGRGPATAPPSGYTWVASIVIDGITVSARTVRSLPSNPEDWETWTVPLRGLAAGSHNLAFRLTLLGPVLPANEYTELEVPAFYVDAILFASLSNPAIVNLSPDVNEGILYGIPLQPLVPPPHGESFEFDILDLGTDTIEECTINVIVNGSTAVLGLPSGSGGGLNVQTGWTAVATAITGGWRVSLLSPTNFASGSQVSVTASGKTLVGLTTVTRTWSFGVADVIPPTMTTAVATGTKTIRVTWNEAVRATAPLGTYDALNVALYTLTPQITIGGVVPAVTPVVTGVLPVTAEIFDLSTDVELSPGVTYSLEVDAVSDLSDNHADTSILFDAFVPPVPTGRSFDLYRMLPLLNRQEDLTQDLLRFIACLQEVVTLALYDVDQWSNILDLDLAPEAYLDAMLEDLGNPFSFLLDVTEKRKLLRVLVAIYQLKGTEPGIINVIRFFLGLTVTITDNSETTMVLGVSKLGLDWILGPGNSYALYSFRIVSGITLTATQRTQIIQLASYMKPAHTHLVALVEPSGPPPAYNPVVLGVSLLGDDWILHESVPTPWILGVSTLGHDCILHDGPHPAGVAPTTC